MSSECELDEGIKSIKSAWRREHTARTNLEKMLERAEAENVKLRWLVRHLYEYRQLYFRTGIYPTDHGVTERYMRDLGMGVDK